MTNRKHNLPLVQQCKALAIHRTTIYRESKPVKQRQLDLMKLIDRIHMDNPAWGCRKVREYLIELGWSAPNISTIGVLTPFYRIRS